MADVLTLDGIEGQTTDVRWEVVSPGLSYLGSIDIDADQAVTVDNNMNRSVKRQLSGLRIPAHELANVDVFRDRLRPVWQVVEPASGAVLEYPLGVFVFASLARRRARYHALTGTEGSADLGDLLIAFDQALDRSVTYPAGTLVETAIADQAGQAGVLVTDIQSTGKALSAPVSWVAGRDTRLKVINDLAALAGFYSPWFDNEGVFVARAVPDLGAAPADFDYDDPPRIYDGTIEETDDALAAPNRYLVIDTGATSGSVSGFYDVPDSAPHSIANRGFAVTRVIEVQGLASPEAARDTARAAAAQDTLGYAWTDVQTIPEPRMDTYNVVQFDRELWRVQSWGLTLRHGGPMRQSWRRVYR